MKLRTAVIYARVSTQDQNLEMQLTTLRDYAARRGFQIGQEYTDHVTGKITAKRKAPGYEQLMADARKLRFDVVLVWKFDRFARSIAALLEALQLFQALDIDFISVTQDIDTTLPAGRLFFHMVAAFAEFERELIVERVRAGIANARRKGVALGRPRDLSTDHKVQELRQQGLSVRKIAAATRRSVGGVMKIIRRCEEREKANERSI